MWPRSPSYQAMKLAAALLAAALAAGPPGAIGAPLRGRWDGVFPGGRGDQAVTLICRPGTAGALGGLFYLGGELMGPLERGVVTGDSLSFSISSYDFRARRDSDRMAMELTVPHGRTHDFALRFTSPDTSALVAAAHSGAAVAWDTLPDSVLAAHRVPADASVGVVQALTAGTLFLVGGGPAQSDLNAEFLRLAGGVSARIVVIPTASIGSGDTARALLDPDRWARALGVTRVTVLHTDSRARADDEAFVQPLRDATAVWLPGGEAGQLLVSYLGTRTERELFAVLARGGVIGGTSAGALVWGSECQVFRAATAGGAFHPGDTSALRVDDPHSACFGALRNIVVAPHFSEFHMAAALAKTVAAHPQLLGIGIDEATVLEVHGNVGSVLGRGHVTICDGGRPGGASPLILNSGTRYDLVRKSVL